MTKDEKQILAMTETLILWDYLAETGERFKFEATEYLHSKNVLEKASYNGGCPLCDRLQCKACVWPHYADENRCLSEESPYFEWTCSPTIEDRKSAAKKVLNLLLSIEF